MGHSIPDDWLFDMLRSGDEEKSIVSFEKFLQMCDAKLTDGNGGNIGAWGKRNIRKDLAEVRESTSVRICVHAKMRAKSKLAHLRTIICAHAGVLMINVHDIGEKYRHGRLPAAKKTSREKWMHGG